MRFVLVAVALVFATSALAQTPTVVDSPMENPRARRVEIDMDADVIIGDVVGPNAQIDVTPKRPKFNSLIQMRKDFRGQLMATGSHL